MKPDGYMFLGAAETTRGLEDQFESLQVGTSGCYRIVGAAKAAASPVSRLAGMERRAS